MKRIGRFFRGLCIAVVVLALFAGAGFVDTGYVDPHVPDCQNLMCRLRNKDPCAPYERGAFFYGDAPDLPFRQESPCGRAPPML